ncbi:4Fe-4S dicluster domain-containing protein [Eggerthella sinensis]|uniref:4Fe-4S dicluster domain-containing protein n=1 Tax=Eggerthella sinensis TaxID=242230 RepID=UPI00266DA44C|nr:4Fe-4S dicluster domain-containing protein [Eggerthella sinensis]
MQQLEVSRRTLVKGALALGASAVIVGGAVAPRRALAEGGSSAADGADAGVQYGFLVYASKCVNCEKCVVACRQQNGLADETPDRRRITVVANDKGEKMSVSTSCMHCVKPSCERVCPAGAISKGACGIVSVDKNVCIGCKYCYQACPYDVPRYSAEAMDKCDCCLGAGIEPGDKPYCVRACIFNALKYGPIEELKELAPDAVVVASFNDPSCLIKS